MLDLNRVILSFSCMKQHQVKVGGVTGNQAPLQMRPVTQDIGEYIVIVTAHILIQKTMLIYSVPEKTPGRRTVMNVLTEMVDVKTVVQIIKDHFPVVAIGKDTGRMAKIVKVCIRELDYGELEISI